MYHPESYGPTNLSVFHRASPGPLPLPLADSAASIRDAASVRGRRWASGERRAGRRGRSRNAAVRWILILSSCLMDFQSRETAELLLEAPRLLKGRNSKGSASFFFFFHLNRPWQRWKQTNPKSCKRSWRINQYFDGFRVRGMHKKHFGLGAY